MLPAGAGRDLETDPRRYIASRTAALCERLSFAAERAGRGEFDGVTDKTGQVRERELATRLAAAEAEKARLGDLYGGLLGAMAALGFTGSARKSSSPARGRAAVQLRSEGRAFIGH